MAAQTPEGTNYASEASSGGLPQFDMTTWSSQIFWLVVTFGILYFVLSRFILPRIGEGISERSDRIADDLDAASRMQKEAELAGQEHERVMAAAKAKAHNISETTRNAVNEEIETEITEAEEAAARKQAAAEARISEMREQALSHVDEVAVDTARAIVEKIASLKPTAAQIKAAVSKAR